MGEIQDYYQPLIDKQHTEITELKKMNEKLKNVLKFYANEEHYEPDSECEDVKDCDCIRRITRDGGSRAQTLTL